MGTNRLFMPLLTELDGLGNGLCYRHVAPNGRLDPRRCWFASSTGPSQL